MSKRKKVIITYFGKGKKVLKMEAFKDEAQLKAYEHAINQATTEKKKGIYYKWAKRIKHENTES